MTPTSLDEQLTKYLTDAHSVERQAIAQLKPAPRIAGDDEIAAVFTDHLRETEEHDRLVAGRLNARDAAPSKLKDAAGALTGLGFAAFAVSQPDTTGKLIVHAFSYEHMEEATYALLGEVAQRAGDEATLSIAQRIEEEERAMGDRLAGCFDRAAEISLREQDPDDIGRQLDKYLADAHAIEGQSLQLLARGPRLAGAPALATAYGEHAEETQGQQELVAARLSARGSSSSALKDSALRLGALNWGAFFAAQPDTPAKLAGFAYALEHLEIGAYEMLKRVAARAGDEDTVQMANRILAQEHAAANRIRSLFPTAVDAALDAQGLRAAG